MCGFSGFVGRIDDEKGHLVLDEMGEALAHRGPDFFGKALRSTSSGARLGMCHALLRIMGREGEGQQPYRVAESLLIFNGAIYNYKELRKELKSQVSFTTDSDTEVLAWGLEIEGISFLKRVRGMYSFAFYDSKEEKLLLVRDKIGTKPLYYYSHNQLLFFSSEYKSFVPYLPEVNINEDAVSDYLKVRYVTGENTFIEKVKKILPGTYLEYDLRTQTSIQKQYFKLEDNLRPPTALFNQLKTSVSRRSVAGVKVGALLSGGIDSAVVCDFLGPNVEKLETYTLSVGDKDQDESLEAREIADRLGVQNTTLTPSELGLKDLRKLVYHLDDPYGDPIILALHKIFLSINNKHRVIVTGEGADELFSGYIHHRAMMFLRLIPSVFIRLGLFFLRGIPFFLIKRLLPYSGKLSDSDLREAVERLGSLSMENLSSFQEIFYLFGKRDLVNKKGLSDDSRKRLVSRTNLFFLRKWDFLNWLPESQLFKLDKISMASSIEAREPYADEDLIINCLSTPSKKFFSLSGDKILFRTLLKGRSRIGDDVILSKKTSFFQPFTSESVGSLPEDLIDILEKDIHFLSRFVKHESIRDLIDNNEVGLLRQKRVFCLALVSIWHDINIKSRMARDYFL